MQGFGPLGLRAWEFRRLALAAVSLDLVGFKPRRAYAED